MALEKAKNAIIYAIHEVMSKTDHETLDWDWRYEKETNIPHFQLDGFMSKVFFLDKPDLNDMSITITYQPSWTVTDFKTRDMKATDFPRLKTLENLFVSVFNKVYNEYDFWTDNAIDILIYYTNEYQKLQEKEV